MEEMVKTPLRQHPYGRTTTNMQRRHSFSRQTIEAIEQGKQHTNGNASPDKSPRKTYSFPSMSGQDGSPGHWGELREEHKKKKRAKNTAEVQDVSNPTANQANDVDASLVLDIKGSSGHFSDDDSDGYSPACSDDEYSPAPSSAGSSSITSSSPLLRRAPGSAGFKPLNSEASEHSSLGSIPRHDAVLKEEDPKPKFSLNVPVEKHLTLEVSPNKLRVADVNAGDNEDDLPDWLLERIVLSPAVSTTKASARSPQQIEDEIRFAVNSAAARVQQELGRREQFQSALRESAAVHSPSPATGDKQSPTSKLFSAIGSDSGKLFSASDDPFGAFNEKEMYPLVDDEFVTCNDAQGDLLLVMEVVISEGRTETIEIHEGDNPDVLASSFAQKHALQPDAVPKLRGLIQEQLEALAETEPEEVVQSAAMTDDNWAPNSTPDCFVAPSVSADVSFALDPVRSQSVSELEHVGTSVQLHECENHRENSYNDLMARYGHYSQHSGKVEPDRKSVSSEPHLTRNYQATEYARVAERLPKSSTAPAFTTMIHTRGNSSKKKPNLADAPAYERLHALAESKDKWILRAQKAKQLELAREQERMHRVEVMDAKSRELVANRTNGGYAHIGERLHGEALSDMAKKVQRHERRTAEREEQQDWMCPKCAYVNQYNDSRCQNIVARAGQLAKSRGKSPASSNARSRETASSSNGSFDFQESQPEVLCGQPKPGRLFQPTLLTTSTKVMKAVCANKDKTSRVRSMRRQRHQHKIEEEFQQTCPFRPKINNVSEDIVREKLETAAAMAAVLGESRQPRNPHIELYHNSFQVRALKEEREEEYFRQFPFKPDIGVNALWVAPDKSQNDFVERLAVDKYHELERKRIALHDKYAPDRDPHTGKELFKPEIGRAPAFSRNKQGLPIGDFLHAAHREQQEYQRQLRKKDQREVKKKSQQTFVSEASRQALERRKKDTCLRIFDELLTMSRTAPSLLSESNAASPEPAKQVSDLQPQSQQEESSKTVIPGRVNLSSLPPEISRVVAIVFEYANNSPISRVAFSGYMDRLVREVPGITYSQIIFLAEHLDTGKHRRQQHSDNEREASFAAAEEKELTFHPVIDKNSREIATKHGRVSSSKVFHALNQYYDHYLERKEQLRKQQQREFKKSHPFQPTFVTKTHQREPAANAFYDKIRTGNCEDSRSGAARKSTASVSSAPSSYRHDGAAIPPAAPLQTAISNARPCVRPIERERSRYYSAVTTDEAQLDDSSRSSSSSQLLEDAELTSRVLAALDEKPSATSPLPATASYLVKALSFSDVSSSPGKASSVRSPEDATLNFDM